MMKVRAFVGKVLNPFDGGWITLPTTKEEIDAQITAFDFGNDEFEIVDLEYIFPMNLGEYRDIYRLNEDLHIIQEFFNKGMQKLLFTAYAFRDENLYEALKLLESERYLFFEEVENEEELGRAVFEEGMFGIDPDRLPQKVKDYMNYESIGLDWIANGTVIYPQFQTAMAEMSNE